MNPSAMPLPQSPQIQERGAPSLGLSINNALEVQITWTETTAAGTARRGRLDGGDATAVVRLAGGALQQWEQSVEDGSTATSRLDGGDGGRDDSWS